MRLYRYVGPKRIAERVRTEPSGIPIRSPEDVIAWAKGVAQQLLVGTVTGTFVLNEAGILLLADRRSEHVVCAGGKAVRSACEITFIISPTTVDVVGISNQSSGYCPEPSSWLAVAEALFLAGLSPPDGFSMACVFRRCIACDNLNLVKGEVFECCICGAELPRSYNVQD